MTRGLIQHHFNMKKAEVIIILTSGTRQMFLTMEGADKSKLYNVSFRVNQIVLSYPDIDDRSSPKRFRGTRMPLVLNEDFVGKYEAEQIDEDTIIFTRI